MPSLSALQDARLSASIEILDESVGETYAGCQALIIISARALAVVSPARVARHEVPKTRVCLLVLKLHLSS